MNRLIIISLVALITNYIPMNKGTHKMESSVMPKVTGIGGIFFFSDNIAETKAWYIKNLGLEINDWGAVSFDSRNMNNPDEINTLQWTLFKKGSDYFAPSKKEFMINYRVQNIEELVNELKEKNVTVVDSIASYDYGKFVHIMDSEGNKIELWETVENTPTETEETQQMNAQSLSSDHSPKVTGIGGVFIIANNPPDMKQWYAENLGFDINEWGSVSFDSRDVNNSDQINTLQWTLFKKGSGYFSPSQKDLMINYRIENIEDFVSQLKENGATIVDSIATYDYGKFVHIMDPEGNKIELWEPSE